MYRVAVTGTNLGEFALVIIISGAEVCTDAYIVALHICGTLLRTFHTVTPCNEKLVTTHTAYRYASEKTSAAVFFTLCRLNSPRITIQKKGDYSCKHLDMG